ncbi:ABC transporter ATP-binding protein [Halanaerobium kushneri]|uniref:ATP-binding cassette, subfamily B, MsbA n=1 Tax=Halanaerobium kushneri TaxID=56779 RepID=A0A1N6Q9U0_9FIRM|nr:ABC transporter ATP-binding protein [Halanaerobium kushneri]SIQ13394.1 ATP-binding cassette, subfamily B, MsbA [Halanaerobium kushneri]
MNSFKRFLNYVKPYWHYILFAAFGGTIKFVLPMIFPQIMRYFVDEILVNAGNISVGLKSEYISKIHYYSSLMIGLYFFVWIPGVYIRHKYAGKLAQSVVFDLRYNLFKHIQRMSASYFDQNKSGAIVTRLISDIQLCQNMLNSAMTNVWIDGSILIFLLIIMFKMDVTLTLISLSILPFYIMIIKTIGQRVKESSRMVQDEIENIQGDVQEKISGATVIRAFTMEKQEEEKFEKKSKKLFNFNMNRVKLSSINNALNGFLIKIAPVIIIWFASISILNGNLSIGEMTAFYAYLGMFYMPIERFSRLNVVFSNSMAAIDRVFEVFDKTPEVQEKENAREFVDMEKKIEFKNVNFSYNGEEKVLKNINLTVEKGEKTAFVGASGAGKSSLVNLIPRFYDVSSGKILIDGEDIREFKLKSLREKIGIVLQEAILFSGTLRENILYGKKDAAEEEIIKAAKAANAYDFIMQLENNFESEVGERGARLSGGQKQRITITRAFLSDPSILILDEATSSLDSRSENLIQESLEKLMEGRTTFIIAHRLSTIMNVDKIVVLEKGAIKEIGSHQELLQKNGLYKKYFKEQFQEAIKYSKEDLLENSTT